MAGSSEQKCLAVIADCASGAGPSLLDTIDVPFRDVPFRDMPFRDVPFRPAAPARLSAPPTGSQRGSITC
jgi:hypothetical protein